MTDNNKAISHTTLTYPVFLIESEKGRELTGYTVVESQTGFVPLGRLPAADKYVDGLIFDSAGYVYEYCGARGWPRFGGFWRPLLEALILPSILIKILEFVVYFGPDLKSARKMELDEFKTGIVDAVASFERHEVIQLESMLSEKGDYISAIESVDWFRYFGGHRDELGLPV